MEQNVALVLFCVDVVLTSISCGAAVIASRAAQKPPSVELQAHVDELGFMVEKLLKEQRKERMTRVRHSVIDKADTPAPAETSGVSLLPAGDLKAQLRAKLRQQKGL